MGIYIYLKKIENGGVIFGDQKTTEVPGSTEKEKTPDY